MCLHRGTLQGLVPRGELHFRFLALAALYKALSIYLQADHIWFWGVWTVEVLPSTPFQIALVHRSSPCEVEAIVVVGAFEEIS